MIPVLLGATAFGLVLALSRRGHAATQGSECSGAPPSPQPAIPPGWTPFRGTVGPLAQKAARAALGTPLGSFSEFTDEQGRELGVLVSWHCHSAASGMRPVGWHKGANLFQRRG